MRPTLRSQRGLKQFTYIIPKREAIQATRKRLDQRNSSSTSESTPVNPNEFLTQHTDSSGNSYLKYTPNVVERCSVFSNTESPEFPDGSKVDLTTPMWGLGAIKQRQLVVRTGTTNWPTHIEKDESNPLLRTITSLFSRDGKFSSRRPDVLISASSKPAQQEGMNCIDIFPACKTLRIPNGTSTSKIEALVQDIVSSKYGDVELGKGFEYSTPLAQARPAVNILICGHSSRDCRCGIMGPPLQDEFVNQLSQSPELKDTFSVELISHCGGHQFAGNVIIYIRPMTENLPLAGSGIFYGRVEPRHVKGIVQQTILDGVIIKELLRDTATFSSEGDLVRFKPQNLKE